MTDIIKEAVNTACRYYTACGYTDRAEAILAAHEEREKELAALREALTPSADTKAAYIGEFAFCIPEIDEEGVEHSRRISVPWDTIK